MRKAPLGKGWAEKVETPSAEAVTEEELDRIRVRLQGVESELARVVVGQESVVREVILAILAGGHSLLEGVPGVGKTLLVRSTAGVLGLEFGRVQCTPDLVPADVTGTTILTEGEAGMRSLRFQHGPLFAQLILADEINRATPRTQSAFLEAMEEHQVTVAGESHPLPEPFLLLATQNPIEMEGTFPLPEAQLDRFLFKILVDYPPRDVVRRIAEETIGPDTPQVRRVLSPKELLQYQRTVRSVPIASDLLDAATELVVASRPEDPAAPEEVRKFVRLGASPRAARAIVLGAKANAILDGRCHVAAEDVRIAARPALRHRLLLNFEANTESVRQDGIITALTDRFLG